MARRKSTPAPKTENIPMEQQDPIQEKDPIAEAQVPETDATETTVAEGSDGESGGVESPKEVTPTLEESPKAVKDTPPPVADTKGVSEVLIRAMTDYVIAMAPNKPQTEHTGVMHQKRLRAALINAIAEASDEAQAKLNINYILDFIEADASGVFTPALVFRFYDSVEWKNPRERKEAETLLTLFTATAKKKTRGTEARKLDWSALAGQFDARRSEVIAARLRAVYGLN